METALQYFLTQGVLGVILVLVVLYFLKEKKKTEDAAIKKSKAWAELVASKDEIIESKNKQIHEMGIDAVTTIKEFNRLMDKAFK